MKKKITTKAMIRARKPRPMTLVQKRQFLAAIPVPPGMTAGYHDKTVERWDNKSNNYEPLPMPTATFTGDDVTIRIEMNGDGDYMHGSGHTTFTTVHGMGTFDRIGVDDSFYVDALWSRGDHPADTPETAGVKLLEQLQRVAEARARAKQSVIVPGLGYSITPETRAKYTADLLAGRSIAFTPSGFGTGYRFTVRQQSRYDKAAAAETREFFGVRTLFIQTLDCD